MPDDPEPLAARAGSEASGWRRVLAWILAFEAAAETSYDDIQDRRILALEQDVARLSSRLRDLATSSLETRDPA